MNISPQFKDLVQAAGFQGVTEEQHKAPLSPWPKDKKLKELGKYLNVQMMDAIEPYSLALFTRVLKWDAPRIQLLLAGVREDLQNLDYHMYSVVYVVPSILSHQGETKLLTVIRRHCVYGQKPPS